MASSRKAAYARRAFVGLLVGCGFLLATFLFGDGVELRPALVLLGLFTLLGLGKFTPTPAPPKVDGEDEP